MNALNKLYSLRNVLLSVLLFYLVINTVALFYMGTTVTFSTESYLLTISSIIAVMLALHYFRTAAFELTAMYSIFIIIFIYPRLFQLAIFPQHASAYYLFNILSHDINKALVYLNLGSICILMGFYSGGAAPLVVRKKPIKGPRGFYTLVVVLIVFILIQLFLQLQLDISILKSTATEIADKPIPVIVSQLANVQMTFLLLVVALALMKFSKIGLTIACLIFAIYSTIVGSRSAGLYILLTSATVLIAYKGNFNLKVRQYLEFALLIIVVSFLSFKVATYLRSEMILVREEPSSTQLAKAAAPAPATQSTPADSNPLMAYFNTPSMSGLYPIFDRLGANMDAEILILSRPGDAALIDQYMNIPYAIKSAINIMVPGVIFDDAQINTSFLPRFIYEGTDKAYLTKNYYESRPYTAWGITYAHFGWWGGLAALFLVMFVLAVGYKFLTEKFSNIYISSFYLLVPVFSFFTIMGVDDYIANLQKDLVAIIFIVFLYKSIDWVRGRK
jgi:hypothetical protein